MTQRGHNRERCFHTREDHVLYLGLLREHAVGTGCAIHAYAFMPNHVHLLLTPPERTSISELLARVHQRYVQSVNRHRGRCGTAWQGRFYANVVDTRSYFITCMRYIELNPVRARLVFHARDYPWSSFASHATGWPDPILASHPAYDALGTDDATRQRVYASLFEAEMPQEVIDRIRVASIGGRPLGDDAFIEAMRAKYGPVVARKKRGPQPRREAAPEALPF